MVFQTTIPVTIGLLFTRWNLGFMDALAVALGSGGLVYLMLVSDKPLQGQYLLLGGAFYVAFIATVISIVLYP
ncbi:MAG: hypothetical protein M3294_01555 [Pseudomonadota bacterium]|nr:hypothetical protein [Pseudomonadota bacterium]